VSAARGSSSFFSLIGGAAAGLSNVRFGPRVESGEEGNDEDFWEDQLESCGLVEVDGARVPLEPQEPDEVFIELTVGLFVPRSAGSLEQLVPRAEAACRQLLPGARIDANGKVHAQYSDHWWIWLEPRPNEPSRDAFERLVVAYDHWQREWDDGWTTHFAWYRTSAAPGEEAFLLPEAGSVFIDLSTYSDPTFRPVPRGRNEGLGELEVMMAGLPPPAGYEAEEPADG
jgi:hypothetical protein